MLLPDEFVYGYGKNKETDAKYFIAYKTRKKIRPLLIKLPKMSWYSSKVEKIQYIPFSSKMKDCWRWINLE